MDALEKCELFSNTHTLTHTHLSPHKLRLAVENEPWLRRMLGGWQRAAAGCSRQDTGLFEVLAWRAHTGGEARPNEDEGEVSSSRLWLAALAGA